MKTFTLQHSLIKIWDLNSTDKQKHAIAFEKVRHLRYFQDIFYLTNETSCQKSATNDITQHSQI